MGIFANETKEQKFWNWFVKNEANISLDSSSQNKSIEQLSQKLTEYKEGLSFEVSKEIDGKREFIISADGVAELFPYVIKLANSAPELKKWSVLSFRPRMDKFKEIKLTYGGREFDPNNIWIYPIRDGNFFDLIVYLPNYSEQDRNLLIAGCYILLDATLGEYDVVKGIRHIDFQKIPEDSLKEGLLPFVELRNEFDRRPKM